MEETITASETTSKNTFEKYLQLIEKIRIRATHENYVSSLNFLETLILLAERSLQDNSNDSLQKDIIEKLNETTNDFLLEQYKIFDTFTSEPIIIDSISYNIMAAITIIKNVKSEKNDFSFRHLFKLYPSRKTINELNSANDLSKILNRKGNEPTLHQLSIQNAWAYFQTRYTRLLDLDKEIKPTMKNNLLHRLYSDFFQFGNLKYYKSLSIEDLAEKLGQFDLYSKIESLFHLDKDDLYFEWNVTIVLSNKDEIYNAKNISYLLYSFSSALESLGGIEVEIDNWGTGSRWTNLKLKIKDEVAKMDLMSVLNNSRQQIDGALNGKTLGEVKKSEAEAKKIDEEASKIRKEVENMPSTSIATQKNELDILSQKIEIEKKYLELEEKREDIRAKKIDNALKASKLINDGIISNDGKIQMFINDCLFIDITDSALDTSALKSMGEIEGKEEKIKEEDITEKGTKKDI